VIIDTQIHELALAGDWNGVSDDVRAAVTCEATISAMDAVGVTHAIVDGSDTFNRVAVARQPERLFAVGRVDHTDADVEGQVAAVIARPGFVALRAVLYDWRGGRGTEPLREGAFDRLFAAVSEQGVPLFAFIHDAPQDLAPVAKKFPSLRLIVDHLGLAQAPVFEPDDPPFRRLDALLELARFENVGVKLSGVPTLSLEPYPHRDVWRHVRRVIDAFGVDRIMWASDFTRMRMVPPGRPWIGTYADAIGYLRDSGELTREEKAAVLARTACEWLRLPLHVVRDGGER
jgi:L-fuconolactonase